MASREQILALTEAGMTPATISTHVGVSESYISQILNESSIKKKVIEAQLAVLDERTARDAKYDALEDTLLHKMQSIAPQLYKPQDVLRALQAINKAERRGATSQQLAELSNSREASTIVLELPERVRTKVVKSHTREVISVNDRALITKDSKLLLEEISSAPDDSLIDPLDVDLPDPASIGRLPPPTDN